MNAHPFHDSAVARRHVRAALLALPFVVALCTPAQAQTSPPPTTSYRTGILCDPCVPPAVREQAAQEKARTAALPSKTLPEATTDRLRARFDAADQRKVGRLTRTEAVVGGFGFIDQHFERIDRSGRGEVSFEDLKVFLQGRGARLE